MGLLASLAAAFGAGREDALSVPAMDGVFKPNSLLDTAEPILSLPRIDNLAAGRDRLYCSSDNEVFSVDRKTGRAEPANRFEGTVTMIAASPSGRLALGVEGVGLALFEDGAWRSLALPADCSRCVTAGTFLDEDNLVLAVGSRRHSASEWKRDLMSHGSTGALLQCRISTGTAEIIGEGLGFPYGLAVLDDGRLAVSESWRHRILSHPAQPAGAAGVLLADLPAYPARLAPAADGGFWLALFAPRRQLTEFVLSEDDYRRDMMATIPPESWIGPDFADGNDDDQPLQAGSVRQMGIMKPWAPSRSYGMVAKLDREMRPVASFHSRADGMMHGIASVVEFDGDVFAASRGGGTLLRLDIDPGAAA
jgi:hypothetical protein